METDAELLLRYTRNRADDAFAEIVRRHIDFVYQTALRQVGGDAHHAADVAQYVFTEVARKAATLAHHRVLKGWLFSTACHAAANIVRSDQRRRRREQEAQAMQTIANEPEPSADWATARPLINDALTALSARDREAVLLRYFEGRDYAEIGARFSLTADAARLRVDRALEKMRLALARAGVTSGAAALAATLTTQAGIAAPAGLAASVTGAALASGAAAGSSALTFLAFMSMTKVQLSILGAFLLMGGFGGAWWHKAHAPDASEVTSERATDRALPHVPNEKALPAPTPAEAISIQSPTAARPNAAATLKEPVPADLRVASQWSNRGRSTPRDVVETFFWAVRGFDQIELAKTIAFTPDDQQKAEALFARLSPEVRSKLKIASPEEMFAWAWSFKRQGQVDAFRVLTMTAEGSDDATVQLAINRADLQRINKGEMQLHRSADGWQWVVPASVNEEIFRYVRTKLLEELLGQKS